MLDFECTFKRTHELACPLKNPHLQQVDLMPWAFQVQGNPGLSAILLTFYSFIHSFVLASLGPYFFL